ncbi:LLM class flavin-dependent oxidoreductase [Brevibacillus migulae]|uniref:LLM class flavin-dependent oxidoreductase n=1 Tax=Brevibacillus migulae TaxID=1644114 RepID=UPI002E2727F7
MMDRMKLSVLDLSPIYDGVNAQEALMQTVRLAQSAERMGYTRFWVAEHHDMPHVASSSPEVLLAYLGARTKSIRIGSGAVLLPYYKPYKVAEVFHLLATMFPGRIDLGIGRAPGGSAHASLALSGAYLEKVRQMPELLSELNALLADDYEVEGQRVSARPVPDEPPELWLLGTNLKSAQYAAQFGAGYVFGHFMSDQDGEEIFARYVQDFQRTVRCPAPKTIAAVGVICADTSEEAAELAEMSMRSIHFSDEGKDALSDQRKKMIVGDRKQVKEQLLQLQRKYRMDECMIVSNIPDYEKRLHSYELLADAMLLS